VTAGGLKRCFDALDIPLGGSYAAGSFVMDFVIKPGNGGEIGISALTERAQKARNLVPGHTVMFKGAGDAIPYVKEAEAQGFTFAGNENLGF
jgi:hypothetical protein